MVFDSSPELSVKTVDEGKEQWDSIGRLYRRPGFVLPEDYRSLPVLRKLVAEGKLMPSITNVIGVRSAPFLVPWAAKLTAQEAIRVVKSWPELITDKPAKALHYLKNTAEREKTFWGTQGTNIHRACELLALDKDISDLTLTEYEQQSVDQWKAWLDKFQPEFKHLEITGFGKTEKDMNYAGTADFLGSINGKMLVGDYKCVVNSTPILLPDGSHIRADEVVEGQEVIAWSRESNLHVSKVSFVGDNGKHPIVRIETANGQVLKCTHNHPILASREDKGLGWVMAADLLTSDTVYLALGWNYSPVRKETPWKFGKYLSPYLFGLIWALSNFSKEKWAKDVVIDLPKLSRPSLKEELSDFGFTFNKKGQMNLNPGLEKIARKNKITVEEVLEILTPVNIPAYVYAAPMIAQHAIIAGVQEIFANKGLHEREFYVVLKEIEALRDLQQLYTNYGQPSTLGHDEKSGLNFLRLPFSSTETIYVYGQSETKVKSIEFLEEEQSTVAIEVQGSHTHITSGLITHNTNRSGLHIDIALQLAANARATEISPDGINLIPMPKIDAGVGVHISPKGVDMYEVDISDKMMDVFSSLRTAWDFHAFEGRLENPSGVFIRKIKKAADF